MIYGITTTWVNLNPTLTLRSQQLLMPTPTTGMEIACTTGLSCRQNKIHDGRGVGIFFSGVGNVSSFEHNDIYKNIGVAAMIVQGANPYFCHNDVGYCEAEAMVVGEGGLGRIEDNQLHDNGGSGIVIQEGGCPIIRHNTITRQERWPATRALTNPNPN